VRGRVPDGFCAQVGVVLVRMAGPGSCVSISCPALNASPCQRKCEARSFGAFVIREPTMNRRFASSSSRRLPAESMPASATTTMSAKPWRAWNCLMIGTMVAVSALLPSKQPISSGWVTCRR
jgi:hypothetical protein